MRGGPVRLLLVLPLLAAGMAACGPFRLGRGALPESPCTGAAASTEGWQVLEYPTLALRVPPGSRRVELPFQHGNEYRVKGFAVRVALSYAEGPIPNPAPPACTTVIRGREAQIVTRWRDGYIIRAAWGNLGQAALGTVGLTLTFGFRDPARLPEAIAVIRSVEFKETDQGQGDAWGVFTRE